MDIGFIGLGNMGAPMAANLVRAGHTVTAYNRSREQVDALVALGARPADSVADACRGEAVVSMLANDAAVEAVSFGPGGILSTLAGSATHVSCSTVSVELAQRLTDAHGKAGQRFVAAPVFGRPEAAAAAKLFVVAAGEPDALEGVSPIFGAIEPAHVRGGRRPGRGQPGQTQWQLPDRVGHRVTGRGHGVGRQGRRRQAAIPRHPDVDAVRRAGLSDVRRTASRASEFEPAGFAATLGLKDVRLVLAAGEDLRVPLPIASLLRDRFLALLAGGGEALDWAAVGALAEWEAGGPRPGS